MNDISEAFVSSLGLILFLDTELLEIILLSFKITFYAVLISSVLGIPLGAFLASTKFKFRNTIVSILFGMMGLPPVVVGLFVYLVFSRSGSLGWMGLLYSPTVMIVAQVILILPIICCLTFQIIESLHARYDEFFRSYRITKFKSVIAYIVDSRFELTTVILAGIGRSISEVVAIIIVGGNIDHITRVMTTAIALETSKGNLDLALGLGMILLATAVLLNGFILFLRGKYLRVPGGTI